MGMELERYHIEVHHSVYKHKKGQNQTQQQQIKIYSVYIYICTTSK